MSFLGWRLTNKEPHVESEEVKELRALLKAEKAVSNRQAQKSEEEAAGLRDALAEAQYQERERVSNQMVKNKRQAMTHLKAAERYFEQMELATGSRMSELKAIVDGRLEKAEQLGFKLNGSITKTIQGLS